MKTGCLDDIVKTVHQPWAPNVAQLVGTQNGDVIIPVCNWSEYFDEYTVKTALKGIAKPDAPLPFHILSSNGN